MQTTLFQISNEILETLKIIEENEGEVSENIEQSLSEFNALLTTETDKAVEFVLNQQSVIKALEEKSKELSDRAKMLKAQLDRFDEYVDTCLSMLNKESLVGACFQIKKRKPTFKAVIHDESKVPISFLEIPEPKPVIRKKEILDALKRGEQIEGCELGYSKISISYKAI